MPPPVPAGAAVAVVGLAVGTAAVLGGGHEALTPADAHGFPQITDPSEVVLPLDDYFYSTDGYRDFVMAHSYLVAECMSRFGVEVTPDPDPGDLPDLDAAHARRLGVFDLDAASEYGYGVPPDRATVSPEDAEPAAAAGERVGGFSATDREHFLIAGREAVEFADEPLPEDVDGDRLREDGCNGEATWILSGGRSGAEGPDWTVRNNDAEVRAAADNRVLAAEAAWSACMREAGYDYRRPLEADGGRHREPGQPGQPGQPGGPAGAEEVADAVTNVECKIETNLLGVWVGVVSEYQQAHIEQHADELRELREWLDAVDRNAQRVLARTDTGD